ncbi:MAG: acyl-CoA ligase (AMP-forming), exosortase A system-associated [Candidatus Nanopelagicales bacterium]
MRTHVHHLVEESASIRGTRSAVTYKGVTLDYSALWSEIRHLASGYAQIGLVRGDRVAVLLDKRLETVTALLAASVAEAVFVPVNPVFKPAQVNHVLADSGARLLVTSSSRWSQLAPTLDGSSGLDAVLLVDELLPDRGTAIALHAMSESVQWPAPPSTPTARGVDSDIAAILYTSGSTGKPKGVVLSHRNLLVGAESVSSYLGNGPDDVILAALPLSFDAGLSQLTTAFAVGAHVVLMNYLRPADVVRLCAQHKVTGLTCVPPLWIQLADCSWPDEATSSMRYFANTGGRMPLATLDRLRQAFPDAQPYLMYGLTEAFRSTYLDPSEVDRRPDSMGKAIPNAEVLVVRPDGTRCQPGEEGELVHRGPLVALGYWNDAARTAERFRPLPGGSGDWAPPELVVWSGDTVVADEEGFLYFVGRADEMIKTSGYRVSPSEIEEVIYATGLVRDAVAVGVPDQRLGQKVVVVVTPPRGSSLQPDDLLQALRRELPLFMVPSDIAVREELPYSPNGKFDRVLIRQEVSE